MVSKFAKSPCPNRDELKSLYESGLTQKQIGDRYGVGYKSVLSWMKKLGIKSRGILHIVKRGNENPQWKGDRASYAALHYRVSNLKGNPSKCEICGTEDNNRTYDWACVGEYVNISDYKRMCRSCHRLHDNMKKKNTSIPETSVLSSTKAN